jgi:sugar phosphate isomerase/epimerase
MSYLSISTWSLHRILGPLRWTEWDAASRSHVIRMQDQPMLLDLLHLPAEAARRGYQAIEVCHFHLPSIDSDYVDKLRHAFEAAAIAFDTLLLDYGDLTSTELGRQEADMAYIRGWIDVASRAGAKRIRVIAGDAQPSDEAALRRAAACLTELAAYANQKGVRVVSENFRPLTSTGSSCVRLLQDTKGEIGFITDFGNFQAPSKYEEFKLILPSSLSVHAKAHYDAQGMPDEAEFRLCLETMRETGYNGAVVLIYDGPGDMWDGLERIRAIVEEYIEAG